MRDGNWKLLINANGSGAELYDLAADPNEAKNLAGEKSAVVQRLSQAALAWRNEVAPIMPTPNPHSYLIPRRVRPESLAFSPFIAHTTAHRTAGFPGCSSPARDSP